MTSSLSSSPMGRPRGFEPEAALQAALDVFWRQGFEATSLDDLTIAMRLSRSSFYGTFGSKQAVLLAAVQTYVDRLFASLEACARSAPDPMSAARAMFDTIIAHSGDDRGCLLVNSITELAPRNPELRELARMHVDRVVALLALTLRQAGFPATVAESRATALVSSAFGATILRKAGLPRSNIAAMLAQTGALLRADPDQMAFLSG